MTTVSNHRVTPWLLRSMTIALLVPALGADAAPQVQKKAQPVRSPAGNVKSPAADPRDQLEGAWKLKASLDPRTGQVRDLPPNIEMTKLIVGGRYSWIVVQDGKALAGAGGTYQIAPDSYTEMVTYAVAPNQQPLVGGTYKFTWKVENGKWYHKGTLRVGQQKQEINEIWERIR